MSYYPVQEHNNREAVGHMVVGFDAQKSLPLPTHPPSQDSYAYGSASPTLYQQFQNWCQNVQYNGSTLTYAMASTTNGYMPVVPDSRRIQGMESTIQYLRELLAKEMANSSKDKAKLSILKKEMEESNAFRLSLMEQLEQVNMDKEESKREALVTARNVLAAQQELSDRKRQLSSIQNELTDAQKVINKLKTANGTLESQVAVLTQELDSLKVASEGLHNSSDSLYDPDQDYLILRSQNDILKHQLNAANGVKNILVKQFNELAKKHLYIIAHSGEQLYKELTQKHSEFLIRLKMQFDINGCLSDAKRSMVNQTLDCIQKQLKAVEDCREEFKLKIEVLMERVDQGVVLVSDLNIKPPKPQFEIQVNNFDSLLEMIARIGSAELADTNEEI